MLNNKFKNQNGFYNTTFTYSFISTIIDMHTHIRYLCIYAHNAHTSSASKNHYLFTVPCVYPNKCHYENDIIYDARNDSEKHI